MVLVVAYTLSGVHGLVYSKVQMKVVVIQVWFTKLSNELRFCGG